MNSIKFGLATLLFVSPIQAFAASGDENMLQGPHVGIDVVRDANEARQPTSTSNASRSGFGGRVHVGYDAVIGDVILVGAEIGFGLGGKTIDQASFVQPGRYKVNPGLTYDATARLGFSPVNGLAVYGRGGYRWLRTEESVAGQTSDNISRKQTEKGFTYGGGVELALSEKFSLRAEFNRTKFNKNLRQNKVSLGASIRF
ncbi:hypothetical protein A8B75_19890 [Sphingomonadales bacterium EhC05]|nr:hypothetical protein A8B75_19890 [Sphingomonadales bacterium EhC05]